ncbi:hypothetical protein AN619_17520 [Thermotalea metallivorans]|uniref:Uncharacterized protein n=1 Tax=Thermotalea metallivorans TaxID=520762 RepID=A0A140L444_9FIRM|nr:hypothetical protein AN619_17520 [Thermotalea metallivorans]
MLDFLYGRLKTDAFAQGLEKNKKISFRGSVQGRFHHSLTDLLDNKALSSIRQVFFGKLETDGKRKKLKKSGNVMMGIFMNTHMRSIFHF